MAFVFDRNAKKIVLRKNRIAPACDPNCKQAAPSVSQDGIHIAGAQGTILIEGNDFAWQGDDSVNITGILVSGRLESRAQLATPAVTRLHVDQRWRRRMYLFRANAPVTIYDLGLNVLGTARVSAVDTYAMVLELADGPEVVRGEVVVTADDRVPTNVVIRTNHFHDHRARGIVIGARRVVIEGTSAISAGVRPTPHYAGEVGTPIRSIRLENNTFRNITSNPQLPVNLGRGVSGGGHR
jgi:hypothetical protein